MINENLIYTSNAVKSLTSTHSDLVSSIVWVSSDEVFSVSEDHLIYRWTTANMQAKKLHQLAQTVFPTQMDWPYGFKAKSPSKTNRGEDVFVLGSTDGKFYLLNRNGKADKGVEAHQGATLSVKWNHNGSSFATAGEDGQIKIWSQSGMLRSTLVQHNEPIYCLAWGPNSTQIVFTLGKHLIIQPVQANSKPQSWKAHEGLILQVDWCHANDLILSGSEDCRYKIWDSFGRLIFSSSSIGTPVTSLSWSSDGQLFAVGGYNTIFLCDKRGWSYTNEKTKTGSLFCIRWSPDSTRLAAAGGNGQVIVAQVTDNWKEWNGFESAAIDDCLVEVRNIRNGATEKLDFRDRVAKISIGFNYLIVVTTLQCHIYSSSNFNTPVITDLKEGNATLIVQCQKYFVVLDGSGLYVYNYEGRSICTPRETKLVLDGLQSDCLSISNDALAVRNQADKRTVYLFDVMTGKMLGDGKPLLHTAEITAIGLDQCGPQNERRLAVLDANKDLYLMSVRIFGANRKISKICPSVTSFLWSNESNLLAALTDDNLKIWYYPNIIFIDADLQTMTSEDFNTAEEFGKQSELLNFIQNRVHIRRANGTIGSVTVMPYYGRLQQLVALDKWKDALTMCRSMKDKKLWACLAGLALNAKNLDIAESAFSEIEEVDKVEFIRLIKSFSSKERRTAELLLLLGEINDAESVLIQSGFHFTAIMLQLNQYNWTRAIELAKKYNLALDIVMATRQAYLRKCNRSENLAAYIEQPKQLNLESKELKERIEQEYEKEQSATKVP